MFLASTVWKLGAVMGGLIGVLLGQERGLEPDLARRYEGQLREGRHILVARVRERDLPEARGMLVESGALAVVDGEGTFELKGAARAHRVPAAGAGSQDAR